MIGGFVNQRYKTMPCRHWETSGQCQMGERCHFAHGKEDMRTMNDPLPQTGQSSGFQDFRKQANNYQAPPVYQGAPPANNFQNPSSDNFKTIKCRFFELGGCKYGENCTFAHGDQDMRANEKQAGGYSKNMNMGGPMNYDANGYNAMAQGNYDQYMVDLNKKIIINQLKSIILNLIQLNKDDAEFQIKLKNATELLNSNNVEMCGEILNGILTNPNASLEEKKYYQKVMADAQAIPQMMMSYDNNMQGNYPEYGQN